MKFDKPFGKQGFQRCGQYNVDPFVHWCRH